MCFYDSIKTWWNRVGRIKLEISSSFKLLLFTESCKVFLDFPCKCRCWVSVRYYRFSDLLFYFLYGLFVVKNYKTGAFIIRINFFYITLGKFLKSCSLLKSLICSKALLLILKCMFFEITLLIYCRNNSAFSKITEL